MSDFATAMAIGAAAGIPVTLIGNWIAINFGIHLRNVKARKRY